MKFLEKTKAIPGALKRRFLMASTAMMALVATAVPAFASSDPPLFAVTSADLQPLLDSIVANIKVVFPIILIVTGMFIVINLVPRLLRKAVTG